MFRRSKKEPSHAQFIGAHQNLAPDALVESVSHFVQEMDPYSTVLTLMAFRVSETIGDIIAERTGSFTSDDRLIHLRAIKPLHEFGARRVGWLTSGALIMKVHEVAVDRPVTYPAVCKMWIHIASCGPVIPRFLEHNELWDDNEKLLLAIWLDGTLTAPAEQERCVLQHLPPQWVRKLPEIRKRVSILYGD